jgi:hypothetical protein
MKNIHLVIAVAGVVLMFGIGEVRGATFPVYAADAFWQDSGIDIIAGQTLNVTASGTVFFQISINGSTRGYANPNGAGLYGDGTDWYGDGPQLDTLAIFPSTITHSLIGKVGGTMNFGTGIPVPEGVLGKGAGFVGSSYSQQIPTTGRLFFAFNDETNNFWDNSLYFTVTFTVTNNYLLITPVTGFTATGCFGGPFTVTNETFSLTNIGTNSLTWSLANTSSWLDASPGGGTLAVGGSTNVIVGLNSNAYSLPDGVYQATVWFTNLNDSFVQSRQFTLAVDLSIILSQPQSLTVREGAPASFRVSVFGTPPLYFQWQKNGTNLTDGRNISGSATTNLLLSSTTANDAGNYSVIISNACGSVVTSSVVTLTVVAKIHWTQWVNAMPGVPDWAWGTNAIGVCVSYNGEVQSLSNNYPSWEPWPTFSGGTVPNPPPSDYGSIGLFGDNLGVNTIIFSKPVVDPVMAIWSLGSVDLTASFVFQTTNLIAIESGGPSAEFHVGTSITQIGNIIYGTEGNGTIQFHGTFTNISWTTPKCDCKPLTVMFTVGVPSFSPELWPETPVIMPANVIFLGSPVTITECAFGTPPLAYQWRTDGGSGGGLTTIPNATNSSLTTIPDTVGTYNYDVVVSDSYGSVASALATVTVLPASAPINTQDTGTADFGTITNIFAFIGGNVNFYANFIGTMPITNQWLVKLDSGGGYTNIDGATNNLWILTNVQSPSAGFYELAVTNARGSWNSSRRVSRLWPFLQRHPLAA